MGEQIDLSNIYLKIYAAERITESNIETYMNIVIIHNDNFFNNY
jgi:hypothetical protein